MATKLLDATPSYEYNRAHIFFVLGNAAITTEWEWNEEHQYSVLLLFFFAIVINEFRFNEYFNFITFDAAI